MRAAFNCKNRCAYLVAEEGAADVEEGELVLLELAVWTRRGMRERGVVAKEGDHTHVRQTAGMKRVGDEL